MAKRITIVVLWFLAGWTLGSFAALATGIPEIVGPVLGLVSAAVVVLDPRQPVWPRRPVAER